MATQDCNVRAREDKAIYRAIRILERRLGEDGEALNSPNTVRNYLTLVLAEEEHEIFMVLFLDAQNKVISAEPLFRGTLTQTSVYPREVVKRALHHNAAAVIFAHNHPSGSDDPSLSDQILTDALKAALTLVDVLTLDHFIIGKHRVTSFAERDLL